MPNRFPCHGRFVNEKNNLNHRQIQAFGEIPGVSAPGGDKHSVVDHIWSLAKHSQTI